MQRESAIIILPVLGIDVVGKRMLIEVKHPLCDKSFNRSISCGQHGYEFVSIDGKHLTVRLEKDVRGIKLYSADVLADENVKSVRLICIPLQTNNTVHTEVKILGFEARGDESANWLTEPVDEALLALALNEIKTSLRSDVSFIYFVKPAQHQMVKIGVSRNPTDRLSQLSTGAFDEINIIGMISGTPRLEKTLHSLFSEKRMNGEWFRLDSTIKALIELLPSLERRSRYESHHSEVSRSVDHHSAAESLVESMRSLIPRARQPGNLNPRGN